MSTKAVLAIADYIIGNERNLRLSEAIYASSYENARERIMKGFFERLTKRMLKDFPGWKGRYDEPFFIDQYGAYDFSNPAWSDEYSIRLEAWKKGDRIIYGVWRDEEKLHKRPRSTAILMAVQKAHPSAISRMYYEAEVTLRSPEPDWREPEVLWRIHTDRDFLEDVAVQLLEVIELTRKLVTSSAKSRRRK
jgi:hypothetical protein